MTGKQEDILTAALALFANEGFAATPTSKIAHKAGVSEGLIFRHFGSKQGLLDALMGEVNARLEKTLAPALEENDPKLAIRKAIEIPFIMEEKEYDFWRLHFMLKWQKEYNNPEKTKPLVDKLTFCFSILRYGNPGREAEVLNYIIEGVFSEILKGNVHRTTPLKSFLFERYGV
ncbi:MAG: TetR/AcrR family transcriptional regulator [Saprospirales bacterium]|nr:TetR/AcrR family transcriptional regulator [Saprospirales bacterium]